MARKKRGAAPKVVDVQSMSRMPDPKRGVRDKVEAKEPEKEEGKEEAPEKGGLSKLLERAPKPIRRIFGGGLAQDQGYARKLTEFDKGVKPKEKYVFHSDYYQVDKGYACILDLVDTKGGNPWGPFWGVMLVPTGMPKGVRTVNYTNVKPMEDRWVNEHQTSAEGVSEMNMNSQAQGGTNKTRIGARRDAEDLQIVSQELIANAVYLHAHHRVQLFAPDLETLDEAVDVLARNYQGSLQRLKPAAHDGEQRRELMGLYGPMERRAGKGIYHTSTEFAGFYDLVTHGIEDPRGTFVGVMQGDYNSSAVLFETDRWEDHVVIADGTLDKDRGRTKVSDQWAARIAQEAMVAGHRVIHLVLNDCDLDAVGPEFRTLTSRIDMARGDINMLEMFGEREDSLSIFQTHLEKLRMMVEQAYPMSESDKSAVRGRLNAILSDFYITNRVWTANAKAHPERLRVVGIPHDEALRLNRLTVYLEEKRQAILAQEKHDPQELSAVNLVKDAFDNMLVANGDLFDRVTTDEFDNAVKARRVVYDFSAVKRRGIGLAMAQLVNVIGYATSVLGEGDVVIVHGADQLKDEVKEYVGDQLATLKAHGGRVVLSYDSVRSALLDDEFCDVRGAGYTIMGTMQPADFERYSKIIGQTLPPGLKTLILKQDDSTTYLRRGRDNIVFDRILY